MQHVAVPALARPVEHALEDIGQVLGISDRIVLLSSHRKVHALILGTFGITRNPEHRCPALHSCPPVFTSPRASSPTTISRRSWTRPTSGSCSAAVSIHDTGWTKATPASRS